MKIMWAWVRCWWYCLIHFKCMASHYDPKGVVKILAVEGDWTVCKVFYERKP